MSSHYFCGCDGLGGIIMTITRELVFQVSEELNKIVCLDVLIFEVQIGGKLYNFIYGWKRDANILVCTPGRLLQHFHFLDTIYVTNFQILVVDESDQILSLVFSSVILQIANILKKRQTLLFSATKDPQIKLLIRLLTNKPKKISLHKGSQVTTPIRLIQIYTICQETDKLNLLWSFITSHLHSKIIVFLTTCKQVRFVYEIFQEFKPSLPLYYLTGRMKQSKRLMIYYNFCRYQRMVLLATDVAGRGLDFRQLHWVLQMDCPQNVTQYIHRVGRAARYIATGRALIFLRPCEKSYMLEQFKTYKIPIKYARIKNYTNVLRSVQVLITKSHDLKTMGQQAFVSLVKYWSNRKQQELCKALRINLVELASSLGVTYMNPMAKT